MTGILSALFAPAYLIARRIPLGEFYTILISALIGMCVLASSADLITLFLGLELMTMPSYLLTGLHKTDRYSNEGGLKYFLLGSFASAILLFGTAWTYGLTGTTSIAGIAEARRRRDERGNAGRDRVPHRWRDLQDRGGPVPLLDPGRLPGRSDPDHRLPLGRAEDRGIRAADPDLRRGAGPAARGLARGLPRPDRADDDGRQHRGPDPDEREADARLLEHRPHRIHHGRHRGLRECPRRRDRGAGHSIGPLLPLRLRAS